MKNAFLLVLIYIFFLVAPTEIAFAQGSTPTANFVPIAPIPGLTEGIDPTQTNGITDFLNNLYRFLIGVAAVVTVIQIIRGGLLIATQESIGKHSEGREIIQQSLLGLLLVLSPVLIFSIINPGILNLSYTMNPLDTTSSTPAGNQAAQQTSVPTTPGSYMTLKDGTLFKQALTADDAGSDKFISDKCSGFPVVQKDCLNNMVGSGGSCPQGTQTWCGKQTGSMTSYYWKYLCLVSGVVCLGDRFVGIAPWDAQNAQTFATTCIAEGGKVWMSHERVTAVPVACTNTTGFQEFNQTQYAGYSCTYNELYKCVGTL
jgi:hypothetical protein